MLAKRTVLVVDDNAVNRELVENILDDEGYYVSPAASGEEGIARFETEHPDCVLLDIRMPGIDGIETCRRLRAIDANVPILFLTADREVDTFDKAREAGGDDYITKPIRAGELLSRVATAVKLRQVSKERGELFDLVRQQRDDLVRLQLVKEQLSAFVVHDLKNPVHAIDLLAQRLERASIGDAKTREIGAKLRDEARSLLRMITNLLDLGRGDEGRLVPRRTTFALAGLVGEVAEHMRARAAATNVTIALDAPDEAITAVADPDLVRRLLENLVDNALRYAPEDSTVHIATARVDGGVELRVVDEGPGVPADMRERVFDRFTKSDGAEAARSNRGLGLSFCKLAVETHGGRISIDDANPGALFRVWIPDE